MLKKMPFVLTFVGAALVASSANAANVWGNGQVSFNGGAAATNLQGLTIRESFESYNVGDKYPDAGGATGIQAPPSNGTGAVPAFGSTGKYLAIQANQAAIVSSGTILVPQTQALSFVIGSLDSYNTVILNFLTGPSVTLNGLAIITGLLADQGVAGNGDQFSAATNGRVFYDTLGNDSIVSFELRSSNFSFEIDNIATAAPEPATWGMMILAAGMAGAALRRRRSSVAIA